MNDVIYVNFHLMYEKDAFSMGANIFELSSFTSVAIEAKSVKVEIPKGL